MFYLITVNSTSYLEHGSYLKATHFHLKRKVSSMKNEKQVIRFLPSSINKNVSVTLYVQISARNINEDCFYFPMICVLL